MLEFARKRGRGRQDVILGEILSGFFFVIRRVLLGLFGGSTWVVRLLVGKLQCMRHNKLTKMVWIIGKLGSTILIYIYTWKMLFLSCNLRTKNIYLCVFFSFWQMIFLCLGWAVMLGVTIPSLAHCNRVLLPIEDSCIQLYGCHRTMCGWDTPESLGWWALSLGIWGGCWRFLNCKLGVGELMLKGLILFPQDHVLIGACSVWLMHVFIWFLTSLNSSVLLVPRTCLVICVVGSHERDSPWSSALCSYLRNRVDEKNGFRKNIGDFSPVSEISKATKQNLPKRYGEVLVPNLKHFKHSDSPYLNSKKSIQPTPKIIPPTFVERKHTV